MLSVAIVVCLGWVVSLCLHEFGHAIVAYWGGDTSVKEKGYLTLNPLKYTDPTLSLLLPLIFLLLGGIALPGGAVYIDHQKLRHRGWQSAVSAAGPIATSLTALVLAIPFRMGGANLDESHWLWQALAFLIFLEIFAVLFNLLPVPPLDGYGILAPWLPLQWQQPLNQLGRYSLWALFGIFWFAPQVTAPLWTLVFTLGDRLGVPAFLVAQGYRSFNQGIWVVFFTGLGLYLVLRRFTRTPEQRACEVGNRLLKAGQYEAAVAAYDQAIALQREDPTVWVMRARALQGLRRSEEALADLDRAIALQPENPAIWNERAWMLGLLGRHGDSILACDRALQLEPKYGLAWYNRASAQAEQGDGEAALESLLRAFEQDYFYFRHLAKTDPSFASLQNHAQFQKMLRYPPHRLKIDE
ncbi:hypothetical protein BST81_18925 [Leptolyngbya sp. 'hensonii']|uniref:TPR end-of-group domain-containing protein n=1 Tax=Leptolyngbya sp. 'hensonii' TaxID=1922337 RepID=UPI00094F8160|nr:tetratricopeptide repeat protein [Leptolyngbya sp. 'hensonii']OLP16771.1 hypothetical protein BST81_18925 [Leptolyngbya sp. 'hensonii']